MERKLSATLIVLLVVLAFGHCRGFGQTGKDAIVRVQRTSDFSIDGKGTAEQWAKADWIPIPQRVTTERMSRNPAPAPANKKPPAELATRAKVLYSDTGIYFLFQCEDRLLQATMSADFMELWWEDVVEIFLWPDESDSTYFEYQISPLNHIRMTKHERGGSRQLVPYEANQRILHRTSVEGGEKESGALITQWTAEVYIPYEWLYPSPDVPPEPGTRWRVNLYRHDYDTGDRTRWAWQPVGESNHALKKFGTFLFE